MRILEVTYYEDNDIHLNEENWINKSNVNLFVDGEIDAIFNDSIYEKTNMCTCMKYIKEKYPNAILDKTGCYTAGWNYTRYKIIKNKHERKLILNDKSTRKYKESNKRLCRI